MVRMDKVDRLFLSTAPQTWTAAEHNNYLREQMKPNPDFLFNVPVNGSGSVIVSRLGTDDAVLMCDAGDAVWTVIGPDVFAEWKTKTICNWCGGLTFDDERGHCCACGGPR